MNTNSSKKIIIAIAVAIAVFACLCLCVITAVSVLIINRTARTSAPPVQATMVVERVVETFVVEVPTETPEPTDLPEPTEIPTLTPEPTETLAPLTIEVPTEESESDSYDEQMVEKVLGCQSGLTIVSEQIVKLSKNKALLSNAEWQGSMVLGLVFMQGSCTSFSEITPVPEAYREGHEYLILAEEEFNTVITKMTEGINENNLSKVQTAAAAMVKAGEYLQSAADYFPEE